MTAVRIKPGSTGSRSAVGPVLHGGGRSGEQGEWFNPVYLDEHRMGAARVTLADGDINDCRTSKSPSGSEHYSSKSQVKFQVISSKSQVISSKSQS